MRVAVLGAGVVRARRRAPADARRATPATSTSAGRGSAARRRRSTSAAATCSSATTTTCSRPTATSPRSTTSSGWPTSSSGAPSTMAFFARRAPVAVHDAAGPAALRAAAAARAACAWGRRARCCSGSPTRPGRSSRSPRATWIERGWAARPWRKVWGPLLRGKFGDARRRHRDGLAVEQAHAAPPAEGEEAARGAARLPAHSWELLFEALRDAIEAGGGRVLIDRPRGAARAGRRRLRGSAGRAGLVPRRPRPARLRADGRRRALRRRRRDACPATSSRPARRRPRGAIGPATSAGSRRPSTTPRSACCSSSTASSRRSTGRTSPTRRCRSSASIEHTNFIVARALRRAALPLRRQLPRRPATRCSALDADELLDRYMPGLRSGQPGVLARLDQARWLHREPAAQPIVTVGYHDRIPPLQTGVPGPGARQHDADLSRGPRDELRGPARRRRRGRGARRQLRRSSSRPGRSRASPVTRPAPTERPIRRLPS